MQQYRYLKLAMPVVFLMTGCGCASLLKSESPIVHYKEVKVQAVSPEVKHLPKKPICLDPGKKDYTVPELESALACQEEYASVVRGKYYSMKTAIEAREAGAK